MGSGELLIRPLRGLPEIHEGDDLGALIAGSGDPGEDEIAVVSQKVVSKAEGRVRRLAEVEPTAEAVALASKVEGDPRMAQLVLDESRAVIRAAPGVLITETRSGLVCANAGIDASNVEADESVVLLPEDPDRSARRIRASLRAVTGAAPGVIVADSFGRPWRLGQNDVAIGCAGVVPIDDWRGRPDRHGEGPAATAIASIDEIAAAADLIRSKDSGSRERSWPGSPGW